MSDHYQYVDTYYTSSYPDGESVNSGATRFNYGYPSQACYGFGQATASSSSASVFVGPNVVKFCACTCNFSCTCLILVQFLIFFICQIKTVESKTGRWEWPGNEAILVYSI